MKILVTGAAGFIGSHLVKKLLQADCEVVGVDNMNPYYDVNLKHARLCNIKSCEKYRFNFDFFKLDILKRNKLKELFDTHSFDMVFNLAGQPGVRYSISNPYRYIEDNIEGFLNIIENCRNHDIKQLIYASSSSVYGTNDHVPFHETDNTDTPLSLYAVTKKSDELMAYAYSSLYHLPTTGVRFFTVYGPWGRPDMAPYKFMDLILRDKSINVYNQGNMTRDFTYVDDIVDGLLCVMRSYNFPAIPFRLYNIGNSNPVKLMQLIHMIENVTGKTAKINMMDMQPGDMLNTYADISKISNDLDFKPKVNLKEGISKLYDWYVDYHK